MEADQLEVCSDSQLVVKKIEDTYEAKDEKMIIYLKKVRELPRKFVLVQLRQISPQILSNSVLKSSTAQLRPGSLGASSAQTD